jgi:hypothetical protein
MNNSNNLAYKIKYSLLTVNILNKPKVTASLKFLVDIQNPDIKEIAIYTANSDIFYISIDGIKVNHTLKNLSQLIIQIPDKYQVDEMALFEIHFNAVIEQNWELQCGTNIPYLEGFKNLAINELKVEATDKIKFQATHTALMDKVEIPKRYLYHYAKQPGVDNIMLTVE